MRIPRIARPLLTAAVVACQHPAAEIKAPSCETIMKAESQLARELKCSENKWAVAVKAVKLKAVPELRKALKDDDAEVRQVAAYSLGMIGDLSAAADLAEVLGDPEVKKLAAKALISVVHQNIRKPEAMDAVRFLIPMLRDNENREDAMQLMELLASKCPDDMRWSSAIPALTKILKEGYSKAARPLALIICGPESALTKAIKENPDLHGRTDIIWQLGDAKMVVAIIEMLSLKGKEFWNIREAAIAAITAIAENTPHHIYALDDAVQLLIDDAVNAETTGIQKAAILALGAIGNTNAIPTLVRLLGSNDSNRYWAAYALGRIAEKNPDNHELLDAYPFLKEMLDSEDQNERIIAFEVMGKIERAMEEKRKTIQEGGWPPARGPATKPKQLKEGEWPTRL